MKKITIVVPAHNEAQNIEPLVERIGATMSKLQGYSWDVLVVDDGSDDSTADITRTLGETAPVNCIELSRNFGKEVALSAGIVHAQGDALILMDADLQHPPAVIPQFIDAWEKGADVVVGVRAQNPDEGAVRRGASALFSYLMSVTTEVPTVPRATDFRLIDRAVADEFKRFGERKRITRGLIDWLGFRRAYVTFNADARNAGKARYGTRKLMSLAISALVSHSLVPLKFAGYLGAVITFFSGLLGLFIIVEQVVMGDPLGLAVSGTAMLAVMILFLNGIVLISLGLASLYIAQIHTEAVDRPLFIVRRPRKSR